MTRLEQNSRIAALALLLVLSSVGCDGPVDVHDAQPHTEEDSHADEASALDATITLTPEAYAHAAISVEPVARRELTLNLEATGSLGYDERHMAVATARLGGRIARVVADYGTRVAAGEPLAWIDNPELATAQAEYRRAVSLLELRRSEFERARLLVEGQAISRAELLRREADWRGAGAELEMARGKLDLMGLSDQEVESLERGDARPRSTYPVRAPISGKVTERRASPGQVVPADQELFVVAELETLWLFLQIFEKDLQAVTVGTPLTLSCQSHPEDRFRGTIDYVGEVLDPHTRTITARAVIDNAESKLKPGMFVYAHLESRSEQRAAPVLAVPEAAVTRIEGQDVVFVVSGERSFEVRMVEVKPPHGSFGDYGGWVEVVSGLTEGERLATRGVFTLKSEALKGGLAEHHH